MKRSIACASVLVLALSACSESGPPPASSSAAAPTALESDPAAPPPMEAPTGATPASGSNRPAVVEDVLESAPVRLLRLPAPRSAAKVPLLLVVLLLLLQLLERGGADVLALGDGGGGGAVGLCGGALGGPARRG